jgi:hypothetical protein
MLTKTETQHIGDHFAVVNPERAAEGRIGIYMAGVCHLRSVFACVPLIEQVTSKAFCIYHQALGGRGRSDQQLQTLQTLPQDRLQPIIEKLYLDEDYFQPVVFEKSFVVPGFESLGEFRKDVVILTTAFDTVGQSIYRHREHGLLVDPCRGWLNSQDVTAADPSVVPWFRENFEPIGMMGVDAFVENFARLIGAVRSRTGAPVVVFNMPSLEPGGRNYHYQFVKDPVRIRWQRFNLALADLSRELDFPVVDADRVLRKVGVLNQMDFVHFLPSQNVAIGREAFRVLRELGLFREDGRPAGAAAGCGEWRGA